MSTNVAPRYCRSEIYSYFDLSEDQQKEQEDINDSYVIFEYEDKNNIIQEVLPLGMFMRMERSNLWSGCYGTSYFSAYFIKLSRCGTMAVVAERFC
jgi:hypothetical protein